MTTLLIIFAIGFALGAIIPINARLSAIRGGGRSEEPALTFDGDTVNGSIADCRLLLQPLRHKLQEGAAIKRCERPREPVDDVKLRVAERERRHWASLGLLERRRLPS